MMTLDWCPGIREACSYWRDAPMLEQTFEALEQSLQDDNDTCIDCARAVVEVVCQVIVNSFHTPLVPLKPIQKTPSTSDWMSAAVRALKLGDIRDNKFKKLVSCHHSLADALSALRDKAGPASHGKDPYLERLAIHHRRTAVLSADAIVTFLHQAYLDMQLNPASSREPWERFAEENVLIDTHVGLSVESDEEGGTPSLKFLLPGGDELPIVIEVSRLLYQLDRDAYVEALNAARGAPAPVVEPEEEQGEA